MRADVFCEKWRARNAHYSQRFRQPILHAGVVLCGIACRRPRDADADRKLVVLL